MPAAWIRLKSTPPAQYPRVQKVSFNFSTHAKKKSCWEEESETSISKKQLRVHEGHLHGRATLPPWIFNPCTSMCVGHRGRPVGCINRNLAPENELDQQLYSKMLQEFRAAERNPSFNGKSTIRREAGFSDLEDFTYDSQNPAMNFPVFNSKRLPGGSQDLSKVFLTDLITTVKWSMTDD